MASPKEQHDSRPRAIVVGTSRPSDQEPGQAHSAGTGSEPPPGAAPDAARAESPDEVRDAPHPADPEVTSSEEP
jgi:hypothetical protein